MRVSASEQAFILQGRRGMHGWTERFCLSETQKAHPSGWALHVFDAWQFPTLTWGDPTLPSALRRFTSEFGMGSGGTTALSPPGKFFVLSTQFFIASAALPTLVKSVTYFSMLLPFLRLSPCCCANYCVLNSESMLKLLSSQSAKTSSAL